MSSVFSATNLSKNYHVGNQDVPVLKNLSFEIESGEFLIIFGPSGCGKSTLLHILVGLEAPSAGRFLVSNTEIYKKLSEDERALFRKENFGMVFQQSNWIKSLSVKENVAFPLLLSGIPRLEALKRAEKILEDFSMLAWADYHPDDLSSGQQQKVAVTRAISTDPKVIIADEPTGNLDRNSGIELMQLLTKLNKEGKTVIMVTHDIDYLVYATTAIEMLDGKVVKVLHKNDVKKVIEEDRNKIGTTN